ncbi:hypothetical protein [Streptomyces sp. NBC_01334]|uniref:hypothetical protein n=1 Tax=Streptomyces sp. NBC_01334 TaxID=2903827 RepID=UPI002E129B70|nr:hypothetical protein OG736_33105 [Streptomyces sp. NBC_01334]
MSLTSEVFLVGDDGDLDILTGERDGRPDGVDLAGPEVWRGTVRGSRAFRRIGARSLSAPVRVHNGDGVAPDEIPAFLAETAPERACSERVAAETRPPDRTVGVAVTTSPATWAASRRARGVRRGPVADC